MPPEVLDSKPVVVDDSASLLSEIAGLGNEPLTPGHAAQTSTPPTAKPAADEGEPIEREAADETADATDEEAGEVEGEAAPKDEPAADPQLAKRLAAIQKAEKRSRETLATERREIADQRADFDRARKEFDTGRARFEQLAANVRNNPTAVLRELGVTDEDLEHVAKHVYAHSAAAAKDPNNRAAVERATRDREANDRLAKTERELAELKTAAAQRETSAKADAAVAEFVNDVQEAATPDAAPLYHDALARANAKTNPKERAAATAKLRSKLAQIADALFVANEEVPDAADVLAEFERRRAAEITDLGLDLPAKKPTKPATPAKPASKTLGGAPGGVTRAEETRAPATSTREIDAEILRDIQANKHLA